MILTSRNFDEALSPVQSMSMRFQVLFFVVVVGDVFVLSFVLCTSWKLSRKFFEEGNLSACNDVSHYV